MRLDLTDTIVAVSSALGSAPAAIVRLSGPAAIDRAAAVFTSDDGSGLRDCPGRRRREGRINLGTTALPASALVFRAPASYTGDDLVELHVPGSPAVTAKLLEALLAAAGVRAAGPGEFTARAHLNGKLELSRVEGVLAAIHSRNDSELRAARRLSDGAATRAASELRRRLIDLLAELEAGIDFVDEGIEFVGASRVRSEIAAMEADLERILAAGAPAEALDSGFRVVLAGRPNVGKSSLLNALTGEARSIVAPVAGTTRDPVAARLTIEGMDVVLLDSAGFAEVSAGADEPGALAQAASARRRDQADLVLMVFDASAGWTAADGAICGAGGSSGVLTVANKRDLCIGEPPAADVCVSALTGDGLAKLRRAISAKLSADGADRSGGESSLNARRRGAFAAALEAVRRAGRAAADAVPLNDLVAFELREAAWRVGEVAGDVAADHVLDRIFARFCVGK